MKLSNTLALIATSIAFISPLAAHADNDGSWNARAHAQMTHNDHDPMHATGHTAMGARMAKENMTSMPEALPEIYRGGNL